MEKGYFLYGKKNGLWEKFHDSGKIWVQESFKDDIKHGNFKFYYPNGTIGNLESWKNGEQEGVWKIILNRNMG